MKLRGSEVCYLQYGPITTRIVERIEDWGFSVRLVVRVISYEASTEQDHVLVHWQFRLVSVVHLEHKCTYFGE